MTGHRLYVCECLREAIKVGSTATVSGLGIVYWSDPMLPFGIAASTFFPTTFLEVAVYNITKRRHAVTEVQLTTAPMISSEN